MNLLAYTGEPLQSYAPFLRMDFGGRNYENVPVQRLRSGSARGMPRELPELSKLAGGKSSAAGIRAAPKRGRECTFQHQEISASADES